MQTRIDKHRFSWHSTRIVKIDIGLAGVDTRIDKIGTGLAVVVGTRMCTVVTGLAGVDIRIDKIDTGLAAVVGTRMDAIVTGLADIGTITDTDLVDLGTRLDAVQARMDGIDNRVGAGEANTADEGTSDVHINDNIF